MRNEDDFSTGQKDSHAKRLKYPVTIHLDKGSAEYFSEIYITHCTSIKDDCLKGSQIKVPPDVLYRGVKINRFINRCKANGVRWAIFSDEYDIWFPEEKKQFYEKHPSDVSDEEFRLLVDNSEKKLKCYQTVYFYGNHNSHYFHKLYRRVIIELISRGVNIKQISHLSDIGPLR